MASTMMVEKVEITKSANEFYRILKDGVTKIPQYCPNIVRKIETVGDSSWKWTFVRHGMDEEFEAKVYFDDEEKKKTDVGKKGNVTDNYDIFNWSWQAVPKGQGGVVTVTIEYHKRDPNVPSPDDYLKMLVDITNKIGA